LPKHEIVGFVHVTIGTCTDGIDRAHFEIDEDGTGDVVVASCFVVIDVDAFELEIAVTLVGAIGGDAVFLRDDFPKCGANLHG
jgi:hypothetical protein